MSEPKRVCKDCRESGRATNRAAPFPGPRCATHHREVTKERKARAHEVYVAETYGLRPGEYAELYDAQDGYCALCRRANGRTKRLAVDHDHVTGEVRGLLCKTCNHDVLGHARDDIEFFQRCIDYLRNPPARSVLRKDPGDGMFEVLE
jgi:Recombination endonuclease VII